jgi:hypothetical protein
MGSQTGDMRKAKRAAETGGFNGEAEEAWEESNSPQASLA